MKNIFSYIIIFLLFTGYSFSYDGNVYLGMSIDEKRILLQDHIFANNESLWKADEYGSYYEDYLNYIEKFLSNQGYSLQDTGNIYFNKYYPEFKKLTDIKIGDIFYLSTSKGIYKATVSGYCIIPSETYINGNIFYVVLDCQDDLKLNLDEPVIASYYENMSILSLNQEFDKLIFDKYKNIIISTISDKKIKIYAPEEDKDKFIIIDTFYDESFRIFKGHFTNKNEEQYIVNFSQRITFEFYANTSYITDSDGNIIYKMIVLQDKDYNFFIVKGIADIDGDGLDEILAEQGYYEGFGLFLYKFDGKNFIIIADGFIYGV